MAEDDRQSWKDRLRRHRLAIGVVAVVLAATGVVAWLLLRGPDDLPEGLVQANGRLEGTRLAVSTRVPGRVEDVLVDEGDAARAGQELVRLEDERVRARLAQAEAAADVVERRLEAARVGLEVLRRRVPLDVATARAAVRQAKADLERARAVADQADRDAERFEALAARGSVPERRGEEARTAATSARRRVDAAEATVATARRRLDQAQLGRQEVEAREREIDALAAELASVRAKRAEAQSALDDLSVVAPADGVVTTRLVDPGETVAAGSPLVDLVDLDRLYLKAYVPERDRGRISLGDPARIHTDAFDEPFAATVGFIASEAEFTPKEVQTEEQRVKLVYAVKVVLDSNPRHRLTPGMPADAVIRWKDGVEWRPPTW